jgi:gas vesicle protein
MHKTAKVALVAAVGFVAGMLLAPKSGTETRRDLKIKANRAKLYAQGKSEKAKMAADEARGTLKTSVAGVNREAAGMAKSTRASAEKVSNVATVEAEKLADEAKTRGIRVAGTAKRTAAKVKKTAAKVAKE